MNLNTEDIIGYGVCTDSISKIVSWVICGIKENYRQCPYFACLNPHAAVIAEDDQLFQMSLDQANFLTADGIGVVYASRIFGGDLNRRVTGMDVFLWITDAMDKTTGGSCFFLGSTEQTLK